MDSSGSYRSRGKVFIYRRKDCGCKSSYSESRLLYMNIIACIMIG